METVLHIMFSLSCEIQYSQHITTPPPPNKNDKKLWNTDILHCHVKPRKIGACCVSFYKLSTCSTIHTSWTESYNRSIRLKVHVYICQMIFVSPCSWNVETVNHYSKCILYQNRYILYFRSCRGLIKRPTFEYPFSPHVVNRTLLLVISDFFFHKLHAQYFWIQTKS